MRFIFWVVLIIVLIIRVLTTVPHFANGRVIKISGIVFKEPSLLKGTLTINVSGVSITTKQGKEIGYGDYLVAIGNWKDGKIINAKIDEINSSGNIFAKIRSNLINFYEKSLPGVNGILLSGIMLGTKSNLPFYLKNKMQANGTLYLLEVSGIKVIILSNLILSILIVRIKRQKAIVIVILFILFYIFIAGFELSTVKGAIVAIIGLIGVLSGRPANSFRNTLIAAFILLFVFPSWINDIGFIISFSVTFAIIFFNKRIIKILIFLPSILREDLAISISAYIGSAPVIFFVFKSYNLLSPFINTLVMWTIAPIMIVGGLAGLISFISPDLGKLILLPLTPLLSYFVAIVNL